MTKTEILAAIRALGLTASYSSDWKEYTVNYHKHDSRRTAGSDYKTSDKCDALDTAYFMANR